MATPCLPALARRARTTTPRRLTWHGFGDGVLLREAADLGLPTADHEAHLLVHGALHAQGLDHEDDAEAAQMEARETAILLGLGLHDPYAV